MNSQEEWYMAVDTAIHIDDPHQADWCRQWEEKYLARMSLTMIYTGDEAKGLADQAVEKAEETAKVEEREPLSEEEKDRLWKAILESCSG